MSTGSYKHIILADDDMDDIDMFQTAVQDCCLKLQISVAKNGRKVIDLLETGVDPDIIVLDLNMPIMNGYDCLREIRKNQKYNNLPIMIFSTSSLVEDIDYCFANGANFYVVKPENYDALTKLVKALGNGMVINESAK